jgi:hypothetical protein
MGEWTQSDPSSSLTTVIRVVRDRGPNLNGCWAYQSEFGTTHSSRMAGVTEDEELGEPGAPAPPDEAGGRATVGMLLLLDLDGIGYVPFQAARDSWNILTWRPAKSRSSQ